MKYIKEYLSEKLLIAPLGEITLGETEIIPECDYTGQELIINERPIGIYIAHVDYAEWLEKKYYDLLH